MTSGLMTNLSQVNKNLIFLQKVGTRQTFLLCLARSFWKHMVATATWIPDHVLPGLWATCGQGVTTQTCSYSTPHPGSLPSPVDHVLLSAVVDTTGGDKYSLSQEIHVLTGDITFQLLSVLLMCTLFWGLCSILEKERNKSGRTESSIGNISEGMFQRCYQSYETGYIALGVSVDTETQGRRPI